MPATYVIATDSFSRANQTGWGTASDSEVWSQPVGNGVLSIVSNRGQVTTNTGGSVMLLGTTTSADLDVHVRFSLSNATNDYAGAVLRYLDANDYVYLRVHNNAIAIVKVVGGVSTVLTPSASIGISNATNYWLHFSAYDTTYLVNVWADGSSEPAGWMLTCVDGSNIGVGQYGLYAFINAGADTVLFDSFQATIIPQVVAKVGGKPVRFLEDTLQISYKLDERQRAQFTVIDYSGTFFAQFGEHVTITDPVLGLIFSGFVLTCKQDKSNTYPHLAIEHQLDCVDNRHLLDKRRSQKLYTNQYGGTIIADLLQRYGAVEHVASTYAMSWSELQTEWQAATLSNTVSTTNASTGNIGAQDLELTLAGTTFTYAGSASVVTNQNALHYTGYASSGYSAAHCNRQIWTGSQTITTNDTFQYDVWIASTSPAIMSGVDFICSDGTTLSSQTLTDQQNLSSATNVDLSGIASDQWYTRKFTMPSALNGKTIVSVQVFFAGATSGTYNSYFRNILYNITSPPSTVTIFGTSSTLSTNVQVSSIGYTNITLSQVTVGNKVQQVTASIGSFSSVGIVQSSLISWVQNLPSGCTAMLQTSIDAGDSYQTATSGNAIPNLLPGMVAGGTGLFLATLATFTLGTDPTAQPALSAIQIAINPSYPSAKTDVSRLWTTASDFNAGTLTNLITIGPNGITLNGVQRTWDDGLVTNQTLFTSGTATQQVTNKQFQLSLGAGSNFDAKSRLDFAGTWQNFTAEVDVAVTGIGVNGNSIIYRTTGWQSANDTYGYVIGLSETELQFGRGTNTSIGAGAFTQIAAVSLSLAANSTHRLKAVVNGNSHTFFVDGVQLISATDSTWPAAGQVGLRAFINAGPGSVTFDNFGICATLTGTWQSPALNLAPASTYGNSLVQWDTNNLPDNTTTISVQTSIDGGSTFQSVSNGGAITGLTTGQSLVGKTVIIQVTLAANSAPVVPLMNAISVWVLGQYTSTGTRTTAPLAYDSMIRLNTSGSWGTASNGAAYTTAGTGTVALTNNEATIANTTGDVHMSLPGSGGDTDGTCRFSLTAATITAGMELRYNNANAFYRLQASTTAISIVKKAGPTVTLATVAVALSLNTFYRIHFRVVGSGTAGPVSLAGSVWLDGTAEPAAFMITATD